MKKLFLASIAMVALNAGGSALAADMPVKAPPPPQPLCANFGGLYVGGQVGAARYTNQWSDRDSWASLLNRTTESTNTKAGFAGGLTGGWNWQARCTVFGLEADYSWASITADGFHTSNKPPVFAIPGDSLSVSSKLQGFGTLRARTGIVVDNLLLYVTGGLAAAKFERSWTYSSPFGVVIAPGTTTTETFAYDTTRWGWTAGVGTEWAMWGNWSLKSEVLYMGFEKDKRTFTTNVLAPSIIFLPRAVRFESLDSIWVSRIGINYRFDLGKSPVYARY